MTARRRFLAASLVLALPALAGPAFAARAERGSGRIATDRRAVAGFDRIGIAGSFEVDLRQGGSEGIELSGDDNLLALVETRVETREGSRSLHIAPREGVDLQPSRPIRIVVDFKELGGISVAGGSSVKAASLRTGRLALSIGGSGDIALGAVEAERVAVNIGGSGRVSAEGRTKSVSLTIGGSGKARLDKLATEDVVVSIGGSGSADVQAEKALKVSIAGSGRVRHGGAAVPTVSIVGSGDVRRL